MLANRLLNGTIVSRAFALTAIPQREDRMRLRPVRGRQGPFRKKWVGGKRRNGRGRSESPSIGAALMQGLALLAGLLCLLAGAPRAHGVTFTGQAGNGDPCYAGETPGDASDWDDPRNWGPHCAPPGSAPGAGDTAVIQDHLHTGGNDSGVRLTHDVSLAGLELKSSALQGKGVTVTVTGATSFTGGSMEVNLVVPGGGTFDWSGGEIQHLCSNSGFGCAEGRLTLEAGATGTWSGGRNSSAITVMPGATLNITGGGPKIMGSANTSNAFTSFDTLLDNRGEVVWSGGDLHHAINNTAKIQNTGVWRCTGTTAFVNDYDFHQPATFVNPPSGLLVKSGAGTTTTFEHDFNLDNSGPIEVDAGAVLSFKDGADLKDGTVLSGDGLARIDGGTLTLTGMAQLGTAQHAGTLELAGGTLDGKTDDQGNPTGSLNNGNTASAFNWSGGMLIHTLAVKPGAVLNVTGDGEKAIGQRTCGVCADLPGVINNEGTVHWGGAGAVVPTGGAPHVVNNSGIFSIETPTPLAVSVVNTGTVNGPPVAASSTAPLVNSGTVAVPAGGQLSFTNAVDLKDGSVFIGEGVTRFDKAGVRLMGATVIGNASTPGRLEFAAGTLDATTDDQGNPTGSIDGGHPDGLFVWSGGTLTHTLSLKTGAHALITGDAEKVLGQLTCGVCADLPGIINNAGTVRLSGAGAVSGRGGAKHAFNNAGVFIAETPTDFNVPFVNAGTLRVGSDAAPGVFNLKAAFTQTQDGTLAVSIHGREAEAVRPFDRLAVSGAATFDGTLRVTVDPAFTPLDSDLFRVLTYKSFQGNFSKLEVPDLGGGKSFLPDYYAQSLDLAATATATTPSGADVTVRPGGDTSVTFPGVAGEGATTVTALPPAETVAGSTLPEGITVPPGFPAVEVTTSADASGGAQVCVTITEGQIADAVLSGRFGDLDGSGAVDVADAVQALRLLHREEGVWVDRTQLKYDSQTHLLCAKTAGLSPFVVGVAGSPFVAPGDADLNGGVDIADAVLVLRHTVGLEDFTPRQLHAADVNADNAVDVVDAVNILKHIVGLPASF